MLILNTGGTFNKRYNPLTGTLEVPHDEVAIISITSTFSTPIRVQGLLYKDSLEMTHEDREVLAKTIFQSDEDLIIVVHGTDTMDQSAQHVANLGLQKVIVFTGSMVPFSIDPIEATANLAMAIGYTHHALHGVYIVMQGVCGPYNRVIKNRDQGKFDYV
ncbi:MAG TPA: asparaginase domain-containing protein [Sulfuricurvum sp.]|nr:MAG: asparaginase [Campylobacterales bacterium 16-40-21]OZA02888.1 MAG: asparaginase [Sulfuricurvum sp. 17-40-25]HQS67154.1 asparaginase domain-containing protein [Sulfuricurvum sp.]HQT36390.1 asparaginase domain-containing protein [Sulfuricurvum sp.]